MAVLPRHLLKSQPQIFCPNTFQEPYRAEGKKTMGLELAEQLGWRMPDVVVYPIGGGVRLVGIWKAFNELLELGWIRGPLPRFFVAQYEGCAPIVEAFKNHRTSLRTLARFLHCPAVCVHPSRSPTP